MPDESLSVHWVSSDPRAPYLPTPVYGMDWWEQNCYRCARINSANASWESVGDNCPIERALNAAQETHDVPEAILARLRGADGSLLETCPEREASDAR